MAAEWQNLTLTAYVSSLRAGLSESKPASIGGHPDSAHALALGAGRWIDFAAGSCGLLDRGKPGAVAGRAFKLGRICFVFLHSEIPLGALPVTNDLACVPNIRRRRTITPPKRQSGSIPWQISSEDDGFIAAHRIPAAAPI
jgi:hypothetical protein